MNQNDLLSLTPHEWQDLVVSLGEKAFHGKQIFIWLHQKHAVSWDTMTNVPMKLRNVLAARFGSPMPRIAEQIKDRDVVKFAIRCKDDEIMESVLIETRNGFTGCVSTQIGCRVQCPYCASGKGGFVRDLTPGEIVAQLILMSKHCPRVDNVVVMGMGEPFHNYTNLMKAVRLMNRTEGLGIGARRITISTSGIVPEIYRLAEEDIQVNLAISLGAPNDALRRKLIPVGKVYNIRQLMGAVDRYTDKTNRRVSFEYTLLKGVNDRFAQVNELTQLVKNRLIHINLITYNGVSELGFAPPTSMELQKFYNSLKDKRVTVSIRQSKGSKIHAACGQLAGKIKDA